MAGGEGLMISTGIDEALESVSVPRQTEPPKLPPKLPVQDDDTLVKGCEQALEGDIHSQSNVEPNARPSGTLQTINPETKEAANTFVMLGIRNAAASAAAILSGVLMWTFIIGGGAVAHVSLCIANVLRLLCLPLMGIWNPMLGGDALAGERVTIEALKKINPEMVLLRIKHLLNLGEEVQPRCKDFIIEYFQKVEAFIAKLAVSSLDEVLHKEMDLLFLQQLLRHVLEISDGTQVTLSSPPTNSPPTGDLVLERLAAAPSCYRRANAELLHQLLMISREDVSFNTGDDLPFAAE